MISRNSLLLTMLPFLKVKIFLPLFIFLLVRSVTVSAQCNLLCNTDFENVPAIPSVSVIDASQVPCWNTTAADNKIEVWHTGFNGVPSYSGTYFIELNANLVSTLYQNFVTTPGTSVTVSFAHRGRAGTDVMSVSIGPVGGPYTTLGTYSDGASAWGYYTVGYTIPTGFGNNYSLRFNSISAAGGNPAIGNFLDAITVTLPSAATLSFNTNTVSCFGGSDGVTGVIVSNGTAPYTYTWTPTSAHTSSLTGITAGTYSVAVTESNGCLTNGTVQVTQNTILTTTVTSQNASCFGGNDGSAQVTASGNIGPYTYSWTPPGITTPSVSGLTAGTYSVQVTSAAGCVKTNTLSIFQGSPLSMSVTVQALSCPGANDGSALATISGGIAPYSYTWTSSAAHTASVSALSPGTYTVYATSSNGCTGTKTFTIAQGLGLTISVSSQNTSCFGAVDGSVSVTVTNGSGPFTYTWMPGGASTASMTGLTPGIYSVNVLSSAGCPASATVMVNPGVPLTTSVTSQNTSCFGATDGTASVMVTNFTSPFTYTWMPGGVTTASVTALAPGTYSVNILSSAGCPGSATVAINPGVPLTTSVTSQNTSCFGAADGAASVTVTNFTGPFTYTWMPGAIHTASVTGLAPGIYSVNILSSAGCPGSGTVTINPGSSLNTSVTSQNTSCFGAADGTVNVIVTNGTGPFTYTWMPGGASTTSVTGLAPGIYSVNILSSNSCPGSATVAVNPGVPLTASVTSQNTSCFGAADGTASITVTNVTGPFTYTWMPGSANTGSVTGLATGIYSVNVLNSLGCSGSATVVVNPGVPLTASVTSQNTSCFGAADGTASVTVTNVTGPFTYTWMPGAANTGSVTGLATRIYSVNVLNSVGCSGSTTVMVNPGPSLNVSVTPQNTSCSGVSDGSAQAAVTNSNVGPYSYTWTPGSVHTPTVSGLAAGNYLVNIINGIGCMGASSFTINPGAPLSVSVSSQNISCFGMADGSAQASASGAPGAYSYTWMPGNTQTTSVAALAVGNYTVYALSANGCAGNGTISITQPQPLTITISAQSVSCFGAGTGTAQVTPSGGTMPYSYAWTPTGSTTAAITGLIPSTYSCTVEDAHHCLSIAAVTITSLPTGTAGVTSATVCLGEKTILSAYGAFSYTWMPGNVHTSTYAVSPSATTQYSVMVKSVYGCIDTLKTTVIVNPIPFVFAGNDTIVNMDEPVTLVGSGTDFYGWIPTDRNTPLTCNYCHEITENPQVNTCYILEAVNEFYCWNRDTVCVSVKHDWGVYIPNAFTPNKDGVNDVFIPVGYGITDIELLIFDRWGELIFKSSDEQKGWNGTYKNTLCKSDVYVYKVRITTMNNHEEQRVGRVTLVR